MVSGPVRVLVTGSRSWDDREAVWAALDQAAAQLGRPVVVVHGAARGADTLAAEWATERAREGAPVSEEPHPVTRGDYDKHGVIAPMLRNTEMVKAGADLCLTFIDQCPCPRRRHLHGTHGSVHCATEAAKAGIPVRHFQRVSP